MKECVIFFLPVTMLISTFRLAKSEWAKRLMFFPCGKNMKTVLISAIMLEYWALSELNEF